MLAETPANFLFHGHHGFHMDSTGFHGTVHIDSMEQIQFHGNSAGIPEKQPYVITKNSGNIENRTPASTKYHVISQMSNLSAAPCNHLKV